VGFFKKIFKGIKKVIKKVGKAIKGVFKKVGKFMGKIGIIGQIGLALVLPGIGQMLSAGLVGATGTGGLAGALSGFGAVGKAAAGFIKGAVNIASRTSNFFSSITDGVTKVLGETVGAAAKSLGVTPESFIGKGLEKVGIEVGSASWDGVWKKTQTAFTDAIAAGKNIFVPTADPSAVAGMIESTTTQVQEGLQSQIDAATSFDVTSPAGEVITTAPNLDAFGPVGEIDGIIYEAGPPPSLLGAPTTQAAPMPSAAPETITGKITEGAKTLYEQGVERAKEAIVDAPRQVVQAGVTKAMQVAGLTTVPEYSTNVTNIAVPTIDMGSTTDIGYGLTTPSLQTYYDTYGANYINSNPYGQVAQLYDVYGAAMKARGFA